MRRRAALQALAIGLLPALAGCGIEPAEPLRIGAQVFPGYEFVFLARALGLLPQEQVRLIDTPTASASIRALATGALDGACLTLDEVLTARERGIPLTVVAVVDVSVGADAVLALPGIANPAALRGRRLAVEQTAVGAVMLDAVLKRAGLKVTDVTVRQVAMDNQEAEYLAGRVDAVITYEPVKSRLLRQGASAIYSSAEIAGRIVDVIAIRQELLKPRAEAVRALVQAHFRALDRYVAEPRQHAQSLGQRMHLNSEEVSTAYLGLDLPDLARNKTWFDNDAAYLSRQAAELEAVMRSAGLLESSRFIGTPLFDGRYL
jgi:NitT/TauT family transport system substrate-binding protein